MNLIPSFEEFEKSNPLKGKITPDLAEKLAEYFSEDNRVVEGSFVDSIKNTLSKTFLGSLSYISMIDKLRTEILKLEKELLSKKYAHEEEIQALNNNIKELGKSDNSAGIEQTKRTITNKKNEYLSYNKLTQAKIQKALDLISGIIRDNKRRREYWEAGKSTDELDLLEFEYSLAKKKASGDPSSLKPLEDEIRKAKIESEKAQKDLEEMKKKEEDKGEKEEEGVGTLDTATPNYNEALKSREGRKKLILNLKNKIADLEDKLEDAEGYNKGEIERTIKKYKKDLTEVKKIHNTSPDGKMLTQEELMKKINSIGTDLQGLESVFKKMFVGTSNTAKSVSTKSEKKNNNN